MSSREQKAQAAADSRPAFGSRQIEARAYLDTAQRQLDIANAALLDAKRALLRREIGGAEWQIRRALEKITGAQEEIVTATGALTVLDTDPF